MDGLNLRRVEYRELSAKQKEIYLFQKVAAELADYGFNSIKLADDWLGADFLAYHKDEGQILRVQLKGRLVISQKYRYKDLYICFPYRDDWYLVPHDTLVHIADTTTNWLNTTSWRKGEYSSANPSKRMLDALAAYRIKKSTGLRQDQGEGKGSSCPEL